MNACDAGVGIEECQRFLRQNGAAGSGHTYGDDLLLCTRHVRSRVISVSQRLGGKSRRRGKPGKPGEWHAILEAWPEERKRWRVCRLPESRLKWRWNLSSALIPEASTRFAS